MRVEVEGKLSRKARRKKAQAARDVSISFKSKKKKPDKRRRRILAKQKKLLLNQPVVNNNNSLSVSATSSPTALSKKKKKSLIAKHEQNLLKITTKKKLNSRKHKNLLRRVYLENQRKLLAEKKSTFQNITSVTNMVNKIKLQPESLDCSIIEESQEIILIDDDEDEEKDKEKNIVQDVNEKESSITNISLNSTVGSISTKCSNEKLKTGNDKFNNTQISHITQSNNNNEDNPKNTIKGSITSKMPILNNQIEENKENKDKQISTHIKEGNSNILLNVLNSNENEIIGKVNNETTNQLYKNYTILYETLTDEIINTKPSSVKTNNKNDSIICLDDDSIIEESVSNMSSCSSSGTNHTYKDDSVIFVSEIINLDKFKPSTSKALDYIPLELPTSYTHRKQKLDEREINNQTSYNTPVRKRIGGDLFTASERKKLINYNTNTYNPNKEIDVQPKTGKRMVLIDGSNVAFHHALNQRFSVKGLEICLEYFEKIGHDVKAIVPQFRLQQGKSTNPAQLEKLHRSGKIVFTPCKNLPGKYASSYDDRFLLQLASELDAAIISNDNYRDLINENPAFKKIIENRVIGYSWCNDMFILPKDPYGRLGPNLNIILNRN